MLSYPLRLSRYVVVYHRLEADPAILDTGIVDGPPENALATGADVGDDDAKHFQAVFQLFQGEVFLRYHE